MNPSEFERQVHDASGTASCVLNSADDLLNRLRTVGGLLAELSAPIEKASLVYRDPAGGIHLQPVGEGLVFGRGPGCEIRFAGHREVSQRQFSITPAGLMFVLRDLSSTNGTFVNDEPAVARERALLDGDLVRVAAFRFAFLRPQSFDFL